MKVRDWFYIVSSMTMFLFIVLIFTIIDGDWNLLLICAAVFSFLCGATAELYSILSRQKIINSDKRLNTLLKRAKRETYYENKSK